MKITEKLATELMNNLTALAISANGKIPSNQKELKSSINYARETFNMIMEGWEEIKGEKWEIVEK